MDVLEKTKAFEMIENKSSREAEALLATAYPETAPIKSESIRTINESEVRIQVTLTKLQLAALERVREVASHSKLGNTLSEIIDMLANTYLEKNDPLRREVKPRNVSAKKMTKSDDSGAGSRGAKELSAAINRAGFTKLRIPTGRS